MAKTDMSESVNNAFMRQDTVRNHKIFELFVQSGHFELHHTFFQERSLEKKPLGVDRVSVDPARAAKQGRPQGT